jgi:predicted TIM-barrel fold metal-dependent hydrolase
MTADLALDDAPLVDAHLHGFEADALAREDPEEWANLITLMGMCFLSSKKVDASLRDRVAEMTGDTLFARLSRRWLADFLGCPIDDVATQRLARLRSDSSSYFGSLMADANVKALFVDDGYPQPRIDPARFEQTMGTDVYRVARLEPMIEQARQATDDVGGLEEFFRAQMAQSEDDPRCIAYKTVIAYRSGLDVGAPERDEIEGSYRRWRESDWRDGRDTSKALRDHLLNVAYEVARPQGRPIHIHSGAGDPDCVLSHVRPANLAPLLQRYGSQPTVLIHSGYPWVEEGAYLAAMYPMAYLEVSLFLPWVTLDADRVLSVILGSVPTSKVLYGSDEASEGEVIWLSAKLARRALERVLSRAVELDYLTRGEAEDVGRDVLARNALTLHAVS